MCILAIAKLSKLQTLDHAYAALCWAQMRNVCADLYSTRSPQGLSLFEESYVLTPPSGTLDLLTWTLHLGMYDQFRKSCSIQTYTGLMLLTWPNAAEFLSCLSFLFSRWYWGLNSEPHTC
jgi:hypothetical protein